MAGYLGRVAAAGARTSSSGAAPAAALPFLPGPVLPPQTLDLAAPAEPGGPGPASQAAPLAPEPTRPAPIPPPTETPHTPAPAELAAPGEPGLPAPAAPHTEATVPATPAPRQAPIPPVLPTPGRPLVVQAPKGLRPPAPEPPARRPAIAAATTTTIAAHSPGQAQQPAGAPEPATERGATLSEQPLPRMPAEPLPEASPAIISATVREERRMPAPTLPGPEPALVALAAPGPAIGARQPARISIGQIDILVNNQLAAPAERPAAPAAPSADPPVSQELRWFQIRP